MSSDIFPYHESQIKSSGADEGVPLVALLLFLRKKWYIIIGFSFVVSLITALISLLFSNQYISSATLVPSDDLYEFSHSRNSDGLLGSKLLGITGGASKVDPVDKSIAVLKSKEFVNKFIEGHGLLPEIMASETWDQETKTYSWNEDLYDITNNKWLIDPVTGESSKPNHTEIYRVFLDKFDVEKEYETGLIKLSFEHISPERSKKILEMLIEDINKYSSQYLRNDTVSKLTLLRSALQNESVEEVRAALANEIGSELQKLAMLNRSRSFAFEVIDPPHYPDEKSGPFRSIIVLASFVLAVFFSIFFLIFVYILKANKTPR